MYEYSRRPNKFKKFILIFLLMVIVSGGSIVVYSMYTKIDIKDYNSSPETTVTRLYNEGASGEKTDFGNVLEEVTKGVVGISKIKSTIIIRDLLNINF